MEIRSPDDRSKGPQILRSVSDFVFSSGFEVSGGSSETSLLADVDAEGGGHHANNMQNDKKISCLRGDPLFSSFAS